MTDIISPPGALPDWAEGRTNLASPRVGSEAIRCTDDSFAPMARMLADPPAVFKPGMFDDYGKWMDGWESKRRRKGGHDWCVIRLGARGLIRGFDIAENGKYLAAFGAADRGSGIGDQGFVQGILRVAVFAFHIHLK